MSRLVFWRERLDIRDDDDVQTLIEQVRDLFPDVVLVVVDTLSQHMPGGDEGTSDMSAALHGCQRIRDDLGTTVLAIHHPSKAMSGTSAAGAGSAAGAPMS